MRISQFWGTGKFMGHQIRPTGTLKVALGVKNDVPLEHFAEFHAGMARRSSGTPFRVLVGRSSAVEKNDPDCYRCGVKRLLFREDIIIFVPSRHTKRLTVGGRPSALRAATP